MADKLYTKESIEIAGDEELKALLASKEWQPSWLRPMAQAELNRREEAQAEYERQLAETGRLRAYYERIQTKGAEEFGGRWLAFNQACIDAAQAVGIDYTKLEYKALMVAIAYRIAARMRFEAKERPQNVIEEGREIIYSQEYPLAAYDNQDYYQGGNKLIIQGGFDELSPEIEEAIYKAVFKDKPMYSVRLPYSQEKAKYLGRYRITIEKIEGPGPEPEAGA